MAVVARLGRGAVRSGEAVEVGCGSASEVAVSQGKAVD